MQPCIQNHILLAEDNDFNRQLTSAVLTEHGYQVTLAEDGERAVALFRELAFDLILMDVGMPRMDGCEATRAIRIIEGTRGGHTPIIAITASTTPAERQACLDSGMDDVLIKPISIACLAESFKKAQGENPCPVTGADGTGYRTETEFAASSPPGALLSEQILTNFSKSPERLATFFRLLCSDLETQLAAMNAAYEAGDRAMLQDAAHAAKGVARGLRDQSLSRLAEEIENLAQLGKLSAIKERLSDCMALYQGVKN